MMNLSIDIETYSDADLAKTGVYRYTESSNFEVLLFAYAYDDGPVQVIDLTSEAFPLDLIYDLTNPGVIKHAFNANFERTCLSKHFQIQLDPAQWRCTAVHAMMVGLPGNLSGTAKALQIDEQKDAAGKALIKYFCSPCKQTTSNFNRSRNLPVHAPDKWLAFKNYCRQDVIVERAIRRAISDYCFPVKEQRLWELDQRMNDHGVRVSKPLVHHAIKCDELLQERLVQEAIAISGLNNPRSVSQLKDWLTDEGLVVEKLNKESLKTLLKQTDSKTAKRMLELRAEMAKTSTTKYKAMARAVCADSRVRGLLQFYGASRTGRWAGRLVQIQNLPQNKMSDLDLARQLLLGGNYEVLELLFDSVPVVLSQLIRTAFIPDPGNRFIVADFSAIEARVIAWLADEKWRLNVFATHGKIYEASAAQMFSVPLESIGKGSPLRQKGKVAELALGYGGGKNALVAMGALNMGVKEEDLSDLVLAWRKANPRIVAMWEDIERCAMNAISMRVEQRLDNGLSFKMQDDTLFIGLPSGRRLAYVKPRIDINRFGREGITYEGVEPTRKSWGRVDTYGGKLTENVVQAVARDCLAEALLRLDAQGFRAVMSVHDEVVLEVPLGMSSAEEVAGIMGQPISWADGLLLTADAYECDYYRKD